MADFRAKITGQVDLAKAKSDLDAFLKNPYKLKIDLEMLKGGAPLEGLIQNLNKGQQAISNFSQAANSGVQNINNSFNSYAYTIKEASTKTQQFDDVMRKTFNDKMTAWARNNTRAVNAYSQELANLHTRLQNATTFKEFSSIKKDFAALQAQARATGNIGKTMGEQFSSALGSVTRFAASYFSIYRVFNTIKEGINTVRELDDALVDLQKTTTGTATQLNEFYSEANQIAKQYGASTQEIIQSAAD